jgi:nucleoside-diphosphate-sugar epimerase
MSWLIVGCGFTGRRLARRLRADGEKVIVSRRSLGDAERDARTIGADVRAVELELGATENWGEALADAVVVVVLAPPGPASPDAERDLVLECSRRDVGRLVYISSTGVYGRGQGEAWMNESSALAPIGTLGQGRKAVDEAVRLAGHSAGLSVAVLRPPGIYGPGRGLHRRIAAGKYRIIGDGSTYVSRVHVDDLVEAILLVGRKDSLKHDAFNVADDHPARAIDVAFGVADRLGVERPRLVPVDEASPQAVAMLTANRRLSNRRLRDELGFRPHYPSWAEGLEASLAEEAATAE